MTTVLLSVWTDALSGVRVGALSGAPTRRSVHPASPVLLTKNGPLGTLHSAATGRPIRLPWESDGEGWAGRPSLLTYLKFENRSRPFRPRNL